MKELALGLRLLFGSGRGNRVRFLLMVVGGAIGVCCLAAVLTIPAILDARDGRAAARQPAASSDPDASANPHGTRQLLLDDAYGSRPFSRVFVARGDEVPAPPPGIPELPRPGEVYLSPALHDLVRDHPALAGLLPGRERGRITAAGLGHPDELYAYVGVTPDRLAKGTVVTAFGGTYADAPAVDPSTLDILRFTLATLVLLPLTVFLTVCARLSAASRTRRLAALRLLGLSAQGTQRVNAAETVAAALLGAVAGLGLYTFVNQVVARTGLPGLRWYAPDGALSASTVAICLVVCPVLAWFAGRAGGRRAARDPLAVRRTAPPARPRHWGVYLLVAGLGVVTAYCVLGATGRKPTDEGLSELLVPLAALLVGSGLILTLPFLSHWLSRLVARSTESLSLGLAMRRNEVEPGSALRVASGLVLVVFAASLAQGVLVELSQVSRPNSFRQDYSVSLDGVDAAGRAALSEVPGTRGHAVAVHSWTDMNLEDPGPATDAVVATCAQLAELVIDLRGCVDGRPVRLTARNASAGGDLGHPGTAYPFTYREDGLTRMVDVTVPGAEARYTAYEPMAADLPLLVPPSAFPKGAVVDRGSILLTSAPDANTVRKVLDGIGAAAPTAYVTAIGVDVGALQQIAVIEALLGAGMVLGLIVGVAAYVVAATDRAVERRSQVTALALLGARPRTLRAVQCAQVVLPLALGLSLALVTGKLTESSYLVAGGGDILWDTDGLPLLALCAAGVLALATAGSFPVVGRRINPELIRRD
ncbi:ABC transporter permease [Streptomyces sp. NBC_01335]|uniref:FtsX-like permease family protein n=1 Tax=Streptomyces sp. NBC_01335 TaxID=2903828 RepID=UPI002E116F21|nr:ABC transporter permease [Streptomyces sp. NBC_01335]